jgi:hypothetical protein
LSIGLDLKGSARRPTGGKDARDGAVRAEPRPGSLRHDVEGWRASPGRPKLVIPYRIMNYKIATGRTGAMLILIYAKNP